jgi:hypothetical protein
MEPNHDAYHGANDSYHGDNDYGIIQLPGRVASAQAEALKLYNTV